MIPRLFMLLCLALGLGSCSKERAKPSDQQDLADSTATDGSTTDASGFDLAAFERDCRRHLSQLSYKHNEEWGMGKSARWDADLEQGIIRWTFPDKIVSAPVQVIGTYYPAKQSLMWAWDHPSVQPKLAKDALKLKAWGEKHGITDLMNQEISCSEAQAWTYTAMACKLAGANGAYRGPSGQVFIFFTFGRLSVSRPETKLDIDLKEP